MTTEDQSNAALDPMEVMQQGIADNIFPGHSVDDPIHQLAISSGRDYGRFAFDALIAAGFQIVPVAVPADHVAVSREDIAEVLGYCEGYVIKEPEELNDYFWDKWGYQEHYDNLRAALAADQTDMEAWNAQADNDEQTRE